MPLSRQSQDDAEVVTVFARTASRKRRKNLKKMIDVKFELTP
jgi:hypothetical protein